MPAAPSLTALIVIADEGRRYALDKPLRNAGFKIRDATNGAEALRLAMEVPDIIILDLHLPDMSGFEVCCRLKAHAATSIIPVLHLSDAAVESCELDGHIEQGDEAYLTHPVEAAELLASVKTLLRGRQAYRQFSSFLEAAPDAVVIVDQDGNIVRINGRTERMFGFGRNELMGRKVEILMPKRFRGIHQRQRVSFVNDPSTRPMGPGLELWGLRKDGTEFPVEISLSPIPDHEGILVASIIRDISDRKQAEEQLRQSEHRQRLLLDSIPQQIATAKANGAVDYCNPQWLEFTGLSFGQIRDWGWTQFIHPDDLTEHVRAWRHSINTGERYECESRFCRADGEYRWHISRALPMRDEKGQIFMWVSSSTDIQDIKQAEMALHDSEARYRRLFETAKDGIFILDANNLTIIDANPYMSELLGYSHDEFCGKELWQLGLFGDKQASQAAYHELQAKGYIRYDHLPLKTKHGEEAEVEFVSNIYQVDGRTVAQCNIRDISERSRMERVLKEKKDELADLHRRKDEFLAMLGHELRSPLAPISNAVNLLRIQRNEDSLQKKARTVIERQLTQLTRLVDDLMEVSRITTGRIHLQQEQVALSGIVENGVETARTLIGERRHELIVSLPMQPIWLYADAARLEQVVVNLLANAAKYTADGGTLSISVQQVGDEAVLRVRDTGVGIAPEVLPRIFDLFTQAERSLDRSQGGLGIGLCLVQRLVELHHGRVEASSTLGQGSEFVVRLPVMLTSAPRSSSIQNADVEPIGTALRLLVVDDNVDSADTLGLLLQAAGHDVRTANKGSTVLKEALNYRPDVVLLDIGLPDLDGYEIAKQLRQHPALHDIVLVAVTGYGQEADHRRSQEAGFDHHLVKPVRFGTVRQILATVLERVS
jgi:PAS domain S-box-containing protein